MTDYRAAWLNFIWYRDMLYTLAFVACLAAMYWYRVSAGKFYPLYVSAGGGLVVAGLTWGLTHLW